MNDSRVWRWWFSPIRLNHVLTINGWDLRILYRDLKSWIKWLKKNGMVWMIRKVEKKWKKIEWNGMGKIGGPNIG